MIFQNSLKKNDLIRRLVTFFIALIFCLTDLFSNFSIANASIQSSHAPSGIGASTNHHPLASAKVQEITIPAELGSIEKTFQGRQKKLIIHIQDAHAIADAQKSIWHIMRYLQKEYGIRQIAVEGTQGNLDPTIFRTFPDKKRLREVMTHYGDRGELSGAALASLLNPEDAEFTGIEDWKLYENGVAVYLEALKAQSQARAGLEKKWEALQRLKSKFYSPALLELDGQITAWRHSQEDVLPLLSHLFAIKAPQREFFPTLYAISETMQTEHVAKSGKIDVEIKTIAQQIQGQLSDKNSIAEFNQKFQDFQTGQLDRGRFSQYLAQFKGEHEMSGPLRELASIQKLLEETTGARFNQEFTKFIGEIKAGYIRSHAEKQIDRLDHRLNLLDRLIALELTREEWNELEGLRINSNSSPFNRFYRIVIEREKFFKNNLARLLDRKKSEAVILITGGFHVSGLEEHFKKEDISYVLISPSLANVPKDPRYQDFMQGKVSWRDYFKVRGGRINLYDAFCRATIDRLIRSAKIPDGNSNGLLLTWREELIRYLAARNRVAEAAHYTPYLDQSLAKTVEPGALDSLKTKWTSKLEKFIGELKVLERHNQLNPLEIAKLLGHAQSQFPYAVPLNPEHSVPADFVFAPKQVPMPVAPAVAAPARSEDRSVTWGTEEFVPGNKDEELWNMLARMRNKLAALTAAPRKISTVAAFVELDQIKKIDDAIGDQRPQQNPKAFKADRRELVGRAEKLARNLYYRLGFYMYLFGGVSGILVDLVLWQWFQVHANAALIVAFIVTSSFMTGIIGLGACIRIAWLSRKLNANQVPTQVKREEEAARSESRSFPQRRLTENEIHFAAESAVQTWPHVALNAPRHGEFITDFMEDKLCDLGTVDKIFEPGAYNAKLLRQLFCPEDLKKCAVLVEKAIQFLKQKARQEKNRAMLRRIHRLRDSTTIIAVMMPTIFFYSYLEQNEKNEVTKTYVRKTRVSFRRRGLFIPAAWIKQLDPNNLVDISVLADGLYKGQVLIDRYYELQHESAFRRAYYYFKLFREGIQRILWLENQTLRAGIARAFLHFCRMLIKIPFERIRYWWLHKYGIRAIYEEINRIRETEEYEDRALIHSDITPRELRARTVEWIQKDQDLRRIDAANVQTEEHDVLDRMNSIISIWQTMKERGMEGALLSREDLNWIARDLERLAHHYDISTDPEISKIFTESYFRQALEMLKRIRKIDRAGISPFTNHLKIMFFLLRVGLWQEFIKEYEYLMSGDLFIDFPDITIPPNFIFDLLSKYVPAFLYKLEVHRATFVGNRAKQKEIDEVSRKITHFHGQYVKAYKRSIRSRSEAKTPESVQRSEVRKATSELLPPKSFHTLLELGLSELVIAELSRHSKRQIRTRAYRRVWRDLMDRGAIPSAAGFEQDYQKADQLIFLKKYAYAQKILRKLAEVERLYRIFAPRSLKSDRAKRRLDNLRARLAAKSAERKISKTNDKEKARALLAAQMTSEAMDDPEWGGFSARFMSDQSGDFTLQFRYGEGISNLSFSSGESKPADVIFRRIYDPDLLYHIYSMERIGKNGRKTEPVYSDIERDRNLEPVYSSSMVHVIPDRRLLALESDWDFATKLIADQIDSADIHLPGSEDFETLYQTNDQGNITFKSKLAVLFPLRFPPRSFFKLSRFWSDELRDYVYAFVRIDETGRVILNEKGRPDLRLYTLDKRESRITPMPLLRMSSGRLVPAGQHEILVRQQLVAHAFSPNPDQPELAAFDGYYLHANSIGHKNLSNPRKDERDIAVRFLIPLGKSHAVFKIRRFYDDKLGESVYETVQVDGNLAPIEGTLRHFRIRRDRKGKPDFGNFLMPFDYAAESKGIQSRAELGDLIFEHLFARHPDAKTIRSFEDIYFKMPDGELAFIRKKTPRSKKGTLVTFRNIAAPGSLARMRRFFSEPLGEWIYETVQVDQEKNPVPNTKNYFHIRRRSNGRPDFRSNVIVAFDYEKRLEGIAEDRVRDLIFDHVTASDPDSRAIVPFDDFYVIANEKGQRSFDKKMSPAEKAAYHVLLVLGSAGKLFKVSRFYDSQLKESIYETVEVDQAKQPVAGTERYFRRRKDSKGKAVFYPGVLEPIDYPKVLQGVDEARIKRLIFDHVLSPMPDSDDIGEFDQLYFYTGTEGQKSFIYRKTKKHRVAYSAYFLNLPSDSLCKVRRFYDRMLREWIYEIVAVNEKLEPLKSKPRYYRLRRTNRLNVVRKNALVPFDYEKFSKGIHDAQIRDLIFWHAFSPDPKSPEIGAFDDLYFRAGSNRAKVFRMKRSKAHKNYYTAQFASLRAHALYKISRSFDRKAGEWIYQIVAVDQNRNPIKDTEKRYRLKLDEQGKLRIGFVLEKLEPRKRMAKPKVRRGVSHPLFYEDYDVQDRHTLFKRALLIENFIFSMEVFDLLDHPQAFDGLQDLKKAVQSTDENEAARAILRFSSDVPNEFWPLWEAMRNDAKLREEFLAVLDQILTPPAERSEMRFVAPLKSISRSEFRRPNRFAEDLQSKLKRYGKIWANYQKAKKGDLHAFFSLVQQLHVNLVYAARKQSGRGYNLREKFDMITSYLEELLDVDKIRQGITEQSFYRKKLINFLIFLYRNPKFYNEDEFTSGVQRSNILYLLARFDGEAAPRFMVDEMEMMMMGRGRPVAGGVETLARALNAMSRRNPKPLLMIRKRVEELLERRKDPATYDKKHHRLPKRNGPRAAEIDAQVLDVIQGHLVEYAKVFRTLDPEDSYDIFVPLLVRMTAREMPWWMRDQALHQLSRYQDPTLRRVGDILRGNYAPSADQTHFPDDVAFTRSLIDRLRTTDARYEWEVFPILKTLDAMSSLRALDAFTDENKTFVFSILQKFLAEKDFSENISFSYLMAAVARPQNKPALFKMLQSQNERVRISAAAGLTSLSRDFTHAEIEAFRIFLLRELLNSAVKDKRSIIVALIALLRDGRLVVGDVNTKVELGYEAGRWLFENARPWSPNFKALLDVILCLDPFFPSKYFAQGDWKRMKDLFHAIADHPQFRGLGFEMKDEIKNWLIPETEKLLETADVTLASPTIKNEAEDAVAAALELTEPFDESRGISKGLYLEHIRHSTDLIIQMEDEVLRLYKENSMREPREVYGRLQEIYRANASKLSRRQRIYAQLAMLRALRDMTTIRAVRERAEKLGLLTGLVGPVYKIHRDGIQIMDKAHGNHEGVDFVRQIIGFLPETMQVIFGPTSLHVVLDQDSYKRLLKLDHFGFDWSVENLSGRDVEWMLEDQRGLTGSGGIYYHDLGFRFLGQDHVGIRSFQNGALTHWIVKHEEAHVRFHRYGFEELLDERMVRNWRPIASVVDDMEAFLVDHGVKDPDLKQHLFHFIQEILLSLHNEIRSRYADGRAIEPGSDFEDWFDFYMKDYRDQMFYNQLAAWGIGHDIADQLFQKLVTNGFRDFVLNAVTALYEVYKQKFNALEKVTPMSDVQRDAVTRWMSVFCLLAPLDYPRFFKMAQERTTQARSESRQDEEGQNITARFRQLIEEGLDDTPKSDAHWALLGRQMLSHLLLSEEELDRVEDLNVPRTIRRVKDEKISISELKPSSVKELFAYVARVLYGLDADEVWQKEGRSVGAETKPDFNLPMPEFMPAFEKWLVARNVKGKYVSEPFISFDSLRTTFEYKSMIAAVRTGLEATIRPVPELTTILMDRGVEWIEFIEATADTPPALMLHLSNKFYDPFLRTSHNGIPVAILKRPIPQEVFFGDDLQKVFEEVGNYFESDQENVRRLSFSSDTPAEQKLAALDQLFALAFEGRLAVRAGYTFTTLEGAALAANIMGRTPDEIRATRVDLENRIEKEMSDPKDTYYRIPMTEGLLRTVRLEYSKWRERAGKYEVFEVPTAARTTSDMHERLSFFFRTEGKREQARTFPREALLNLSRNTTYRPLVALAFARLNNIRDRQELVISKSDIGDYLKWIEKKVTVLLGAAPKIETMMSALTDESERKLFRALLCAAIFSAMSYKPQRGFRDFEYTFRREIRIDLKTLARHAVMAVALEIESVGKDPLLLKPEFVLHQKKDKAPEELPAVIVNQIWELAAQDSGKKTADEMQALYEKLIWTDPAAWAAKMPVMKLDNQDAFEQSAVELQTWMKNVFGYLNALIRIRREIENGDFSTAIEGVNRFLDAFSADEEKRNRMREFFRPVLENFIVQVLEQPAADESQQQAKLERMLTLAKSLSKYFSQEAQILRDESKKLVKEPEKDPLAVEAEAIQKEFSETLKTDKRYGTTAEFLNSVINGKPYKKLEQLDKFLTGKPGRLENLVRQLIQKVKNRSETRLSSADDTDIIGAFWQTRLAQDDLKYAEAVLAHYKIGKIRRISVLPGMGPHGKSLHVTTDRGNFVLRPLTEALYPDLVESARFEVSLMRQLEKEKMAATRLIVSDKKDYETEEDRCWNKAPNGKIYLLYEYAFGEKATRYDLNLKQFEAMTDYMTELHRKFADFYPAGHRERKTPVDFSREEKSFRRLKEILGEKKSSGEPLTEREEVVFENLDFILGQIELLRKNFPAEAYERLPKTVIHGDFGMSNAVFNGDSVASVFDWDHARRDARLYELVDWLYPFARDPSFAEGNVHKFYLQFLLARYHRRLGLTDEEKHAFPEMLRFCFLWTLGRIARGRDQLMAKMYSDLADQDDAETGLALMNRNEKFASNFSDCVIGLRKLAREIDDGTMARMVEEATSVIPYPDKDSFAERYRIRRLKRYGIEPPPPITFKEAVEVETQSALYTIETLKKMRREMDESGMQNTPLILWQNQRLGEMYPYLDGMYDPVQNHLGIRDVSEDEFDRILKGDDKLLKRLKEARFVLIKKKFSSVNHLLFANYQDRQTVPLIQWFARRLEAPMVMIDHSINEASQAASLVMQQSDPEKRGVIFDAMNRDEVWPMVQQSLRNRALLAMNANRFVKVVSVFDNPDENPDLRATVQIGSERYQVLELFKNAYHQSVIQHYFAGHHRSEARLFATRRSLNEQKKIIRNLAVLGFRNLLLTEIIRRIRMDANNQMVTFIWDMLEKTHNLPNFGEYLEGFKTARKLLEERKYPEAIRLAEKLSILEIIFSHFGFQFDPAQDNAALIGATVTHPRFYNPERPLLLKIKKFYRDHFERKVKIMVEAQDGGFVRLSRQKSDRTRIQKGDTMLLEDPDDIKKLKFESTLLDIKNRIKDVKTLLREHSDGMTFLEISGERAWQEVRHQMQSDSPDDPIGSDQEAGWQNFEAQIQVPKSGRVTLKFRRGVVGVDGKRTERIFKADFVLCLPRAEPFTATFRRRYDPSLYYHLYEFEFLDAEGRPVKKIYRVKRDDQLNPIYSADNTVERVRHPDWMQFERGMEQAAKLTQEQLDHENPLSHVWPPFEVRTTTDHSGKTGLKFGKRLQRIVNFNLPPDLPVEITRIFRPEFNTQLFAAIPLVRIKGIGWALDWDRKFPLPKVLRVTIPEGKVVLKSTRLSAPYQKLVRNFLQHHIQLTKAEEPKMPSLDKIKTQSSSNKQISFRWRGQGAGERGIEASFNTGIRNGAVILSGVVDPERGEFYYKSEPAPVRHVKKDNGKSEVKLLPGIGPTRYYRLKRKADGTVDTSGNVIESFDPRLRKYPEMLKARELVRKQMESPNPAAEGFEDFDILMPTNRKGFVFVAYHGPNGERRFAVLSTGHQKAGRVFVGRRRDPETGEYIFRTKRVSSRGQVIKADDGRELLIYHAFNLDAQNQPVGTAFHEIDYSGNVWRETPSESRSENRYYPSKRIPQVFFDLQPTIDALKLKSQEIRDQFRYEGELIWKRIFLEELYMRKPTCSAQVLGGKFQYATEKLLARFSRQTNVPERFAKQTHAVFYEVLGLLSKMSREKNQRLMQALVEYAVELTGIPSERLSSEEVAQAISDSVDRKLQKDPLRDAVSQTIASVESILKYRFPPQWRDTLIVALTESYHPSWKTADDMPIKLNGNLAYLGDALLGVWAHHHFSGRRMIRRQGHIFDAAVSKIISNVTMAHIMEETNLWRYVKSSNFKRMGTKPLPPESRIHEMGDAFEAIMAAVYLSGGWEHFNRVAKHLYALGFGYQGFDHMHIKYQTRHLHEITIGGKYFAEIYRGHRRSTQEILNGIRQLNEFEVFLISRGTPEDLEEAEYVLAEIAHMLARLKTRRDVHRKVFNRELFYLMAGYNQMAEIYFERWKESRDPKLLPVLLNMIWTIYGEITGFIGSNFEGVPTDRLAPQLMQLKRLMIDTASGMVHRKLDRTELWQAVTLLDTAWDLDHGVAEFKDMIYAYLAVAREISTLGDLDSSCQILRKVIYLATAHEIVGKVVGVYNDHIFGAYRNLIRRYKAAGRIKGAVELANQAENLARRYPFLISPVQAEQLSGLVAVPSRSEVRNYHDLSAPENVDTGNSADIGKVGKEGALTEEQSDWVLKFLAEEAERDTWKSPLILHPKRGHGSEIKLFVRPIAPETGKRRLAEKISRWSTANWLRAKLENYAGGVIRPRLDMYNERSPVLYIDVTSEESVRAGLKELLPQISGVVYAARFLSEADWAKVQSGILPRSEKVQAPAPAVVPITTTLTGEASATLQVVSPGERDRILHAVNQESIRGRKAYYERFAAMIRALYPQVPVRSPELTGMPLEKMMGEGLVVDIAEGAKNYFILRRSYKKTVDLPDIIQVQREAKDSRKEFLVSSLFGKTKRLINAAGIRFLTRPEAELLRRQGMAIDLDHLNEYYLQELVTAENLKPLSITDVIQAWRRIFVFNILVRKYDPHPANFGFPSRDSIPVSLDNEMVLMIHQFLLQAPQVNDEVIERFGQHEFLNYLGTYTNHAVFMPAFMITGNPMFDSRARDQYLRQALQAGIEFVRRESPQLAAMLDQGGAERVHVLSSVAENVAKKINQETSATIRNMGLGFALIAAELFVPFDARNPAGYAHAVREVLAPIIREFKSVSPEEIESAVLASGYSGREAEAMVSLIRHNQANLGRDVERILKFITGEQFDYGLTALDYRSEMRLPDETERVVRLAERGKFKELFKFIREHTYQFAVESGSLYGASSRMSDYFDPIVEKCFQSKFPVSIFELAIALAFDMNRKELHSSPFELQRDKFAAFALRLWRRFVKVRPVILGDSPTDPHMPNWYLRFVLQMTTEGNMIASTAFTFQAYAFFTLLKIALQTWENYPELHRAQAMWKHLRLEFSKLLRASPRRFAQISRKYGIRLGTLKKKFGAANYENALKIKVKQPESRSELRQTADKNPALRSSVEAVRSEIRREDREILDPILKGVLDLATPSSEEIDRFASTVQKGTVDRIAEQMQAVLVDRFVMFASAALTGGNAYARVFEASRTFAQAHPGYEAKLLELTDQSFDAMQKTAVAYLQADPKHHLNFSLLVPLDGSDASGRWFLKYIRMIESVQKQAVQAGISSERVQGNARLLVTSEEANDPSRREFFKGIQILRAAKLIVLNTPETVYEIEKFLRDNPNAFAFLPSRVLREQIAGRYEPQIVRFDELLWKDIYPLSGLLSFKAAQMDEISATLLKQIPQALPDGMAGFSGTGLVIYAIARELMQEISADKLLATMA